jgi:hypothetical protein
MWVDQISVIDGDKTDTKKHAVNTCLPASSAFDEGRPVSLNLAKRLLRNAVGGVEEVRLATKDPRAEPGRRNPRWGVRSEQRLPWRVTLAWWAGLSILGWMLIAVVLHVAGML